MKNTLRMVEGALEAFPSPEDDKWHSGDGSKIPGTQKTLLDPIGQRENRPSYLWSPLEFSF